MVLGSALNLTLTLKSDKGLSSPFDSAGMYILYWLLIYLLLIQDLLAAYGRQNDLPTNRSVLSVAYRTYPPRNTFRVCQGPAAHTTFSGLHFTPLLSIFDFSPSPFLKVRFDLERTNLNQCGKTRSQHINRSTETLLRTYMYTVHASGIVLPAVYAAHSTPMRDCLPESIYRAGPPL